MISITHNVHIPTINNALKMYSFPNSTINDAMASWKELHLTKAEIIFKSNF